MEESSRSGEKRCSNRDHLQIQIVNEDIDLVSSIKQKMESISPSHCIGRVPAQLSSQNIDKYHPSLVSIGPLHHRKVYLKPMEDTKWLYFNRLLSRRPNAEATLEKCISSIRPLEQKARRFYGERIEMGSDDFVEMLLVDSCFIIEFFLEYIIKNLRRRDDPCFVSNERLFLLRCDLILFENQVPFFILDIVFNSVPIPKNCQMSLVELALCFFKKLVPIDFTKLEIFGLETHHLLDLIRQFYLPTTPQVTWGRGQVELGSATQLTASGIRVEKVVSSESPLNIRFINCALKVPSLEIHGYTEILFRNLVAMEHCHPGCSKNVTSYVALMGRLIWSKRDVGLLYDKEILIDGHESEGEIVSLFKKLYVDVSLEDFYYRGLCEEINGCQTRRRRVGWEKIRHSYHRSQLGIAGLSLAILVLVLIFTAALFAAVTFMLHHFQ